MAMPVEDAGFSNTEANEAPPDRQPPSTSTSTAATTGPYAPLKLPYVPSFTSEPRTYDWTYNYADDERIDHHPLFYERHFGKLYLEVWAFCDQMLCQRSPVKKLAPVHLAEIQRSPNLKMYMQTVARPDKATDHWARILKDADDISFLMQGIIMRFLVSNVFKVLMFGADPYQESILRDHDMALIEYEGER